MKPRKLTKTMKTQMASARKTRAMKAQLTRENRKCEREYIMPVPIQAILYGNDIPSAGIRCHNTSRSSIMEERFKESPEVRAAIERKANCLAPAYSKGAYQYIADEESAKCAGRKNV